MSAAVTASYPVACQQLTSMGFSAGDILNAAQAGNTQVLPGMQVTYLGLGQFSLQTPRPSRPPSRALPRRVPSTHHEYTPPWFQEETGTAPLRALPVPVPPRTVPRQRSAPRAATARRTGRHAAPMVKTAAGVALPAAALAGIALVAAAPHAQAAAAAALPAAALAGIALVAAAPHAQAAAVKAPAHPLTRVHTTARAAADRTYTVRPGDTLAAIAARIWAGHFAYWVNLYMANKAEIHDPNVIYPGQVLHVPPATPAAHLTAARTSHTGSQGEPEDGSSDGTGNDGGTQQSAAKNENDGSGPDSATPGARDTGSHGGSAQSSGSTSLSGTLSCSGLEQLWEQAGGSPSAAVTAASVAMAESSGRQYAVGPVGERGYWQIAPFNPGSSFDAMTNAHEAVALSGNGTNWNPWTTYKTGAYQGQC